MPTDSSWKIKLVGLRLSSQYFHFRINGYICVKIKNIQRYANWKGFTDTGDWGGNKMWNANEKIK